MDLSDVDVYDKDNYVAGVPHEMFATLRREAPVYWHPTPDGGGFWSVTRHDDLVRVNRDPKLFSSGRARRSMENMEPDPWPEQRLMMLNMDPPEHTKLRKLVNKGFTPRMIAISRSALADGPRAIVDDASSSAASATS